MPDSDKTPKRVAGPRLQHVVAHMPDSDIGRNDYFDEVIVYGQELDALRSILGKPGWVYAAVQHGQSFVKALKADQS